MAIIKTYNKISDKGLRLFESTDFQVTDTSESPDAIVLRSQKLHDLTFNENLKAIGRAGAGVNNIPVDKCTDNHVVVFNTPGANANAVKELVIAGMLLSARDIVGGINFSRSLKNDGDQVGKLVEANKSKFKGTEISGKTLSVIGLGAIGVMVANAAIQLGLSVQGYDPYISVDRAWGLSTRVTKENNLQKLLETSDFVTVHMPLTDNTRNFLNAENMAYLNPSATILNFSRDGIVDESVILASLNEGKLHRYVTDFPTESLLTTDKVLPIPHLGASTQEAEENCAVMIANQVKNYMKYGNILNSVNFPNCSIEKSSEYRIAVATDNVPNMVGQITKVLADEGVNIAEMINKSKADLAYNIVDFNDKPSTNLISALESIEGVRFVRLFS